MPTDSRRSAKDKGKRKATVPPRPSSAKQTRVPLAGEIDLLKILRSFSSSVLTSQSLDASLQEIKSHLYLRSFEDAFQPSLQPSYVARWVPSRALAYRALFLESTDLRRIIQAEGKALCIGGGAGSELVALCAVRRDDELDDSLDTSLEVVCVDLADWSIVFESLVEYLLSAWPSRVSARFSQGDALDPATISTSDLESFDLVTILFTLSELFTFSRSRALAFLHRLTQSCKPGSFLLIVDSASSYSELMIGSSGRKYPTSMVLDHFLLSGGKWEKSDGEESRWYRLPDGLNKHYPLQLEDARYFWRLYRRSAA
jgi:25S rRNA (uracil2843-N3)-methyltransferase